MEEISLGSMTQVQARLFAVGVWDSLSIAISEITDLGATILVIILLWTRRLALIYGYLSSCLALNEFGSCSETWRPVENEEADK